MNELGSLITKLGYYKLPYRLTQAETNCRCSFCDNHNKGHFFRAGYIIQSLSFRGDKSYFGFHRQYIYFHFEWMTDGQEEEVKSGGSPLEEFRNKSCFRWQSWFINSGWGKRISHWICSRFMNISVVLSTSSSTRFFSVCELTSGRIR